MSALTAPRPTNLWTVDGASLRLHQHAGQLAAWDSSARFVFVFAGTQSGKTSWLPWWLWREIQRRGAGDYLAVTASFDLFKLKFLPAMREVFEHTLGAARYWSQTRILELADPVTRQFKAQRADDPMWGRIILRSAASGGGLESSTAKAAALDECGQDEFDVETWEAVQRRLTLHQGRVLGATTVYNLGWTKTEVYDRWLAGDRSFHVVQFPSTANPAFPPEEYERAKASMPAWRFAMFYDGVFKRPAGLIYEAFDEDVHLIDPFEIPAGWPRYFGADFGGVNNALIWAAHDLDRDRYILYRESLAGGLTADEHAAAALEASRAENVVEGWGGAPSEDQYRRDWAAGGFEIKRPPIGDMEGGIDRVNALLKTRRLFVFRTLTRWKDEVGGYRRKVDAHGETLDEIVDKRKYHIMDATRYLACGLGADVPTVFPGSVKQRSKYLGGAA